jgi:hypothetical protein
VSARSTLPSKIAAVIVSYLAVSHLSMAGIARCSDFSACTRCMTLTSRIDISRRVERQARLSPSDHLFDRNHLSAFR